MNSPSYENFPTRARVVVIGGGVGGASTFYHLTTHGWTDVVLIERDEWASGTTWHSAGQVTQFGTVQTMVGLKKYSCELYSTLAADPDRPITYRRDDGGIRLGYDQQDLDGYSHFVGMAKGMGVDFEVISPSEMAEAHPLLDVTGLTCGLWDPIDGDIDPTGLVTGLVHAGRKNGGEAFRFTDCTGLTQTADGWIVHTNQGDIECESIVNAAGYRVHQVGNFYGLESRGLIDGAPVLPHRRAARAGGTRPAGPADPRPGRRLLQPPGTPRTTRWHLRAGLQDLGQAKTFPSTSPTSWSHRISTGSRTT